MAADFPQREEGEEEMESQRNQNRSHSVFNNLNSKVDMSSLLPCPVGHSDQTLYNVVCTPECERQEAGITGGHLGGWHGYYNACVYVHV